MPVDLLQRNIYQSPVDHEKILEQPKVDRKQLNRHLEEYVQMPFFCIDTILIKFYLN